MSSMLLNQQYIADKESLNRSTYQTRFCIDRWTKCDQRLTLRNLVKPVILPPSDDSVIENSAFAVTSRNMTTVNNESRLCYSDFSPNFRSK